MDTHSTMGKGVGLRIRREKTLRGGFVAACYANDRPAAKVPRDNDPALFRDEMARKHFHQGMFHGFDFDPTKLRVGYLDMTLHGVNNPDVCYRDGLAQTNDQYKTILMIQ